MLTPMEDLYDRIDEEIYDAKTYAWKALEYKSEHPDLAKIFATLAEDELRHATTLNLEADKLAKKAGTPYSREVMNGIDSFFKKKMHERVITIRTALTEYKGG